MNNQIKSFVPPKTIEIKEHIYSFKDELKNNHYTYRCKHRKNCGLVINLEQKELEKYIENPLNEIKYEITSKLKEHKCKEEKNIIEVSNKNKKEINDKRMLARSLIMQNLDRYLSHHVQNLRNNNIHLKKNAIKWLLQKVREEKYPTNEDFLKDISQIVITHEPNPNIYRYVINILN